MLSLYKKRLDKIGAGDAMLALASCFKRNLDELLTLYLGSLAAAHVEPMSNSSPIDKNKILKIISHQLLN